ncbi:MAG: alpha/beta hydrolase [Pseudomonadota bacterium]
MKISEPKPPPLGKLAAELLAVPKIFAAPLRSPSRIDPFGDGRPAIVIPGMLAGDGSTALLRATLNQAGFKAHGWGQRLNAKVTEQRVAQIEAHIGKITEETGRPAIIIGWSLGGMFARLLAHRRPDQMELAITLGSPFSGDRRANNAWRVYEAINDHGVNDPPFEHDVSSKPPVRTIAIWSARDGIVAPESASGTARQSDLRVELPYKHFELATSRRAIDDLIGVMREELRAGVPSALAVAQLPPLTDEEIARRLPVWSALSDTFLDTELDEQNYLNIAELIAQAGYTKQELETIYRAEVEPAFSYNLLNPAGEWAGWPEEFVCERVLANRKSAETQAKPRIILHDHVKSEWVKISRALDAL